MKTTKILRTALVGLLALGTALPAAAQKRKEKEERMERIVKEAIESRHYRISVEHVYPQRGGGRSLSYDYSVEVRNDSLFSYLPYFGVAHRIPYGGGQGLIFDAPLSHYQCTTDKKNRTRIEFDVRNDEDSYTYHITLYTNGAADIHVQPNNKDSIYFTGRLEERKEE